MGWLRKGSGRSEGPATTVEERLAAIEPGVPGHCPSCDGLGYIDNLDIAGRFQIQHCKACGRRWEYLFDSDGHVVGLTELDEDGHPVARTRIRAHPPVDGEVLDLRTPPPDQVSAAEWLRRTADR